MMLEVPKDLLSVKSFEIKTRSKKGSKRSEKEKSIMISHLATKSQRASVSSKEGGQKSKFGGGDHTEGEMPKFSNLQCELPVDGVVLENIKKVDGEKDSKQSKEAEEEKGDEGSRRDVCK